MSAFNNFLIQFTMYLAGKDSVTLYNSFTKEKNLPLEELQRNQLDQFLRIFKFAKNTFPYYDNLFSKLKLHHTDFRSLNDLNKIPILTKNDIIANYDGFLPRQSIGRYSWSSTGGSTGTPLKYRLSNECNSRGWALGWRGFSCAGYNVGDKLVIFGGGSLIKDEFRLSNYLRTKVLNYIYISSYGMSDEDLRLYFTRIAASKTKFIYGYPSSISLLAIYIRNNKLSFDHQIKGIFTTAEMLTAGYRENIESVFNCKVFDHYGTMDGGISALEDQRGFKQIDTERSILEVVDESDSQIQERNGRILATSLYNYAFPFFRYDVGDSGMVTSAYSDKNNPRLVLTNLLGRTTDYLEINGKIVGSPVLTVLMANISCYQYQFVQIDEKSIELRIYKTDAYSKKQEDFIRQSMRSNLGDNFNLNIIYTSDFEIFGNKHKFIVDNSRK
jgi:phenylacetate-CoA ligase